MHIADEKAQARASIRERIGHLAPHERDAESRSICRRVLEYLPPAPLHICLYHAIPSEASLDALLPALWERGDTVFLPRFAGGTLTFGQLDADTILIKGQLNILEPPPSSPSPRLDALDIVLTPGMAFDRLGHRLGRGNGGYDRWLQQLRAANSHVQVWGTALDCQLLPTVPSEPHDQLMDAIVTPREIVQCKRN